MQLRDRGKLSLDDRIVRWVPELRTMHDPYGMMDSITIRMLLSHTAGFQNGTWPYGNDKPWEPFEPTTWNQLVAMMPYQELLFRPGSRYGYSNPAFIYLARVIEQVTGDPWDAYVQKNIFAPLELDSQLLPRHTVFPRGAPVAQLLRPQGLIGSRAGCRTTAPTSTPASRRLTAPGTRR